VYALALAAALLLGFGSAVQQRVAARAPAGTALHWRLLWYLARQPLWLVGIAAGAAGSVLAGVALGIGGVTRVEPLLATGLLFALPIASVWNRYRLGWRGWAAAVAVVTGLVAFLVAGDPEPGRRTGAPVWQWALTAGSIGLITTTLVALARRLRPRHEASVLGVGAGMLFGLQSALTSVAVSRLFGHGLLAALLSLTPYAAVVVAAVGTLLAQSAYKLASLAVSYPPMAAAEPLAGIVIGLSVLGARLRVTPLSLTVQIVGLMVMTAGVYTLAEAHLGGVPHRRTAGRCGERTDSQAE
jgi:drug/metabolite transporter (DMT)-like permease